MKAFKGSKGKAALILNLGTRQRWWVNITLQVLYPQEINPVLTEYEEAHALQPVWTFWRRKIFCPCWNSKPRLSNLQPSHYTDYANLADMFHCTYSQFSVISKLVRQHNNGISNIHSSYLWLLHNIVMIMQLFNFKSHVAISLQHNCLLIYSSKI